MRKLSAQNKKIISKEAFFIFERANNYLQ